MPNVPTASQNPSWTGCVWLFLVLLYWSPYLSLAETYYATPTMDTPCLVKDKPCMTLSQYAEKPSSYFSLNMTIIILPGNHTLDQNLTLIGLDVVNMFSAQAASLNQSTQSHTQATATVTITCSQTAAFTFSTIGIVFLSGLTTIGCGVNKFFSLGKFSLQGSNIVGNGDNRDGIWIENVTEVDIIRTSFLANMGFANSSQSVGALASVNNKHVTIRECKFHNNSVMVTPDTHTSPVGGIAKGGAFYVYQSSVQIDSTTFSNNRASDQGGVVYALNSTVALRNCTMSYNKAHQGGTIYADGLTGLTIDNGSFSNNEAFYSGGVIESATEFKIEIYTSTFHFNSADLSGGVIHAQHMSVIHFNNCTLENNTANSNGGVINTDGNATVAIHNSKFQYNEATTSIGRGGVIAAFSGGNITINGSQFNYNRAWLSGGVVYASNTTQVTVKYSHFQDNKAEKGSGGVLYAKQNCYISINTQSTFFRNKAGISYSGGVLFAQENCTVNINSTMFDSNMAKIGGVIAILNSVISTVYESTFQYNQAESGGVIVANNNSSITINDCHFQSNVATSELHDHSSVADGTRSSAGVVGAAIHCNITLISSTFYNNTADSAGVIAAKVLCNVTLISSDFYNNNAAIGGVIVANSYSVISIHNSTFGNNTATSYGGVMVAGRDVTVTIENSDFQFNAADSAGGVIFINLNTKVIIDGSQFKYNRANLEDGGVVLVTNGYVKVIDSDFDHNRAENGNGGVIYSEDNSDISIDSQSTFNGNRADTGAVVAALNFCNIDINNATFEHNKARTGGAISASVGTTIAIHSSLFQYNLAGSGDIITATESTTITMISSHFEHNSVTRPAIGSCPNIGAISVQTSCIATLNSSRFYNNTADTGGVLLARDFSIINIHNSSFESNTARNTAGVLAAIQNVTVTIYDSNFQLNACGKFGGVITGFFNTTIYINGSDFYFNRAEKDAGTLMVSNKSSVTISSSHFQHNTAVMGNGGVINGQFDSIISITAHSTFFGNAVAAVNLSYSGGCIFAEKSCTVFIRDTTFQNNTAPIGGAISIINETKVSIQSSTFLFNQARAGGAIGAKRGTTTVVNGSHFQHNKSERGGAILSDTTTVMIQQSHFEYNQAEGGGAIGVTESTVTIHDSQFKHNSAGRLESSVEDWIYDGGAISAQDNSNITVYSTTFTGNRAEISGGVVRLNGPCSIRIYNSKFETNSAFYGGCIATYDEVVQQQLKLVMLIQNTSFTYNQALGNGGVILSTNSDIRINSSTFCHNRAEINGGVLLVDYDNSSVEIQNSTLNYNTAAEYGGAILCTGSGKHTLSAIIVENVSIFYNSANFFGGAISLYKCNFTSNGYIYIIGNVNTIMGGGILHILQSIVNFNVETNISNNVGSVSAIESTVTFSGTTTIANGTSKLTKQFFFENTLEAGAITLLKSNLYLQGNTTLMHNQADLSGGAIVAIDSTITTSGVINTVNNTAAISGGGIYAYQSQIRFNGISTIAHNTAMKSGGAIHATASTVELSNGTHRFHDNSATENGTGGALFLELSSRLQLIKTIIENHNCSEGFESHATCIPNATLWLLVEFQNNFADFGGAVFVKDSTNSESCLSVSSQSKTQVWYLPTNECFIQAIQLYYSLSVAPAIPAKNTFFKNNTAAIAGNDVYGGLLDRCTLNPFVEYHLSTMNMDYTPINYLKNVTNIQLDSISSLPLRICFCQKVGKGDCSYQPAPFKIMKGQSIKFSAVAVDQVNHTLPFSTIHCSPSSQSGGLAEGQTRQDTSDDCTELTYTVFSPNPFEELVCYAEGPCNDLGISKRTLQVHFLPCPIGFKLTPANSTCDCDPYLQPAFITNCSIFTGSLLRKNEFWISYLTEEKRYVIHFHCPFDYCYPPSPPVTFDLSSPSGVDKQCSFNHSGKLCGKCKPGLSIPFGSSHCKTCSNHWLLLLIPFALAGFLLVAFILTLNLTVAVGTINGIIFYANIIAVNSAVYFPFEKPNFLTVFISWLNLDFGIETCFYNGMDTYVKTWLQFVFPLYVIFLVAAIIVISDYSPRFASLFTGKNPVATLATLILLSYTKLLRTIIAALSFAQLNHLQNESHEIVFSDIVWLPDANVSYLQGKHIPLFIAAVITALVGLMYTIVLFSWQLLLRCQRKLILLKWMTNSKLLAFVDAYHAPYNEHHRYWTGMLLLLRTVLYLISAVNVLGDPRVNLVSIICAIVFLFSIYATLPQKPKRNCVIDFLDVAHLVNLSIFTALTFYFIDSHGNQTALAYTSTSIAAALFGLTVIYHMYAFTFKRKSKRIKHILKTFWNRNMQQTRRRLYTLSNTTELPNIVGDSEEVTVTEVNALPSIHSTMESDNDESEEDDSMHPQDQQNESDTAPSECDETVPLLINLDKT